MPRIPDFDLIVLDRDVDGMLGAAGDDDALVAGHLQLRPPEAARLRLAVRAGQRRAGRGGEAGGSGDRRAGEQAVDQHQHIVRPQRIGARRDLAQQQIAGQRLAAGIEAIERLIELFDTHSPVRQIDAQELARASVTHAISSECVAAGSRGRPDALIFSQRILPSNRATCKKAHFAAGIPGQNHPTSAGRERDPTDWLAAAGYTAIT